MTVMLITVGGIVLLSKSLIHFLFADFDSGVNYHFRQDFWQFSAMQNCNTRRKGD
jgi:hypothetical protein